MSRKIDSIVIAIGLPPSDEAKVDRMKGYFLGLLQKYDADLKNENIEIPVKDGKTAGIAFITCKDSDAARKLAFTADTMPFDKTFNSVRFFTRNEYEKYINRTNAPEFTPVAKPPATPVQFSWFYATQDLLDQIVWLTSKLPHAAWFNHDANHLQPIDLPQYIQASDNISFTNDGSFFVTKSQNKLNFYVGEQWTHFTTIEFPNLNSDYLNSPCGRYIVCKTSNPLDYDNKITPQGAALFDILTGNTLAKIPYTKNDTIQFGAGSNLISTFDNKVYFYKVFDSKVRGFKGLLPAQLLCQEADLVSASPAAKLVYTFRKAKDVLPARNAFYSTETGKEVQAIPAFNATSSTPFWHPKLALCAIVQDRLVKNRTQSSLVIFDLSNERSTANYTEEIKGQINACAWDPSNKHLACIIGTSSGRQLVIYDVDKNLVKLCQHPCSGVSGITFSPAGRFFICDDIRGGQGAVQFWDTESGVITKLKDTVNVDEVKWDSSGALVILSSNKSQAGATWFSIYLFDGNECHMERVTNLSKVFWRPRAAEASLTEQDLKAIEKEDHDLIEKKSAEFGQVDPLKKEEQARRTKVNNLLKWNQTVVPQVKSIAKPKPQEYQRIMFSSNSENS